MLDFLRACLSMVCAPMVWVSIEAVPDASVCASEFERDLVSVDKLPFRSCPVVEAASVPAWSSVSAMSTNN